MPALANHPLLEGRHLVRDYGGQRIVEVDAIEVRPGEVLALLGPNGAGKSTLLRLLAGLERPDAGQVLYKGREVRPNDRALRRAAVAAMQRPYLWRSTVEHNIQFGLKTRRIPATERRERIRSALAALEITHLLDAPVDTLSGGEIQRVGLARALALEPEILLLDEPTADLDVSVRRRLLRDLERIVRGSAPAVLLITHDPGEAFALADRVAVMEGGRIVQVGTPAEIFEAPSTQFVATFTGAEFMLDGSVEHVAEGTLTVRLHSGQTLEAAGSGAVGERVRVAYRPEDVIIAPPASSQTSARNRFTARVTRLHPQGGLVRLRLESDGLSLEALITRPAREQLGLALGAAVVAQIKATALHVFPG